MSERRFAGRVGLFVFAGIVLIAGLMLNFSRGVGFFKPKYELDLRIRNIAGLKERSAVYFLGVQVGNVKSVRLDQSSKSVVVRLQILKEFPLRRDAKFMIEQIGFLGDQFVIVYPGGGEAPFLKDGEEVEGTEPFNLTEVARTTSDLLKRFDQLGAVVGEAINRVNHQVLDPQTLSNLSRTISNFQQVSDRTMAVIDDVAVIVTNNAPALTAAMTNLVAFTERLEKVLENVDETIVTNREELNASMKNLQQTTASLKKLAGDLEAGKGVVGGLMHDEAMRTQISLTISNLSVLSSNFNSRGLWSVLWKPKHPKEKREPAYSGKSEFK